MPSDNSTFSDHILDRIFSWGVDTLFIIPGAHVNFFLNKAAKDKRFKIVMAMHEQGAGYMADGYARMSEKAGVAVTINGPGATNLTTAAVTAKAEHSQVLFLTGDSPQMLNGYGAFQSSEASGSNTGEIMKAAIEYTFNVETPHDLQIALSEFEKALKSNVQYPIHINLPCDVAASKYKVEEKSMMSFDMDIEEELQESFEWLNEIPIRTGEKVALLVGDEVKRVSDRKAIADFSSKYSIPVAVTYAAKNFEEHLQNELSLGIFGYAGSKEAHAKILDPQLDTLFVFGAVLNERNTCSWDPDFFHANRKILRFSYSNKTAKKYPCEVYDTVLKTDIKNALSHIERRWSLKPDSSEIVVESNHNFEPCTPSMKRNSERMSMTEVIKIMNTKISEDALFFVDSGEHRVYAGFFWAPRINGGFYSAAHTAPMGWAICAAIGASFARPNRKMWVLTGDGCMQMHGLEISVAVRYNCQVIFIVSNNKAYGRVGNYYKDETQEIKQMLSELHPINWVDFAKSFNANAMKATNEIELEEAIELAEKCNGPFVIEIDTLYCEDYSFENAVFSSSSTKFIEKWRQRQNDKV
ncbi:MAG: thiamine pyrophosphate-binding protein [Bacillota bacterium]